MLGNDVRNMSPWTKKILIKKEVIAIGQDRAGLPGTRIKSDAGMEIWARLLQDGAKAVVLFKKGDSSSLLTVSFSEIAMNDKVKVRDLFRRFFKRITRPYFLLCSTQIIADVLNPSFFATAR